jgi:hypothetical protein
MASQKGRFLTCHVLEAVLLRGVAALLEKVDVANRRTALALSRQCDNTPTHHASSYSE